MNEKEIEKYLGEIKKEMYDFWRHKEPPIANRILKENIEAIIKDIYERGRTEGFKLAKDIFGEPKDVEEG